MTDLPIAFGAHRVIIRSDQPEVLEHLGRTFRWMRSAAPGTLLAEIEVGRRDDRYVAQDPGRAEATGMSAREIERWVQYRVIEHFIRARTDLLWLHAAAAGIEGRTVILPGRRGRGKSSLVAELWKRGWTFLTDDILPIDPRSQTALAFPQTPAVRNDPGRELSQEALGRVGKSEVPLSGRVADGPLPVAAIILPVATRAGTTTLEPCPYGEAALVLLEGCWNFADLGEQAVRQLSEMVPRVTTWRLTFHDPTHAADTMTEWASQHLQPGSVAGL